ncbi:MAG: hypothetical protein JSV91_03420 [Phycisphaerales bacterium]|nr:MAG: hypothetical protein JSV91_03420 [Phycisphaerales bacterium]
MTVRLNIGAAALLLAAGAWLLSGCQLGQLIGGAAQNAEYQKLIEVLPKYEGLDNQMVAVVVVADLATLYEHPDLVRAVTGGVTLRIGKDVPGVKIVHPDAIVEWQYRTPQWDALPFGDLTEKLNVDRVVYVDIYEYRLHPPGNSWLWEGVCAANVGVIERDGIDPDVFADSFNVTAEFPRITGVTREAADASRIERGLLTEFTKHVAWLFYTHEEPKYPDKYRPELEAGS